MKKIFALVLSAIFIMTPTPAVAVDDWLPPETQEPPGFVYETDSMGRNGLTHFIISEPKGNGQSLVNYREDNGKWSVCPVATSALDCGTGKVGEIQGASLLPVCGDVIESCIEKVWVYKQGEAQQEATYKRTVDGWTFAGVPSKGVPTGSAVSIWQSSLQHTGGNGDYSVSALLNFKARGSRIQVDGFDLRIAPVNEVADSQARIGKPYICVPPNGGPMQPCGSDVGGLSEGNCIYMQTKICARAQVPAPESRFGLQLILHNDVTGWFRGRVSDPNISVAKVNAMYNRVTIFANPVEIPKLIVDLNTKEGDPDFWKLFPRGIHLGANYGGAESTEADTIKMLDLARAKAKDTATGISSLWAFNTVTARTASNNGANRCLDDKSRLVGIVTTNAMAYVGTAPKFSNGFLSYDVSGMHYLPDGSLATGTYDLVMRSDVARCLYGFSNAPLSATVSVVNEKGTKTTATTVVSEKNGWLKMAAYGFTFSKKTIKVKITKKKK